MAKEEIDLIEREIRFWRMSFFIGVISSFILGIIGGIILTFI